MAGITAFFLGLARQRTRQFTALVVTGLLVGGVLHGICDAAASAHDGLVVLVFAAVLATFIAYAERGEQVLERLAGPPPVTTPPALAPDAP
jgi:RsiW-degrading membrane proteinase PrsW (M82 family)